MIDEFDKDGDGEINESEFLAIMKQTSNRGDKNQGLLREAQSTTEAYFACDKNEEMAANILFEAGATEDEDVATQNAIAASQAVQ